MPAKSKAQYRFMKMMEHNPEKARNKPKGLSKKEAAEFTKDSAYKDLPEKVEDKKYEAKRRALQRLKT